MAAQQSAADYVSSNPDISPNPNPASIAPVEAYQAGTKSPAPPASTAAEQKKQGTSHPTLSQGIAPTFPDNIGGARK